jgi:hypothetical protein
MLTSEWVARRTSALLLAAQPRTFYGATSLLRRLPLLADHIGGALLYLLACLTRGRSLCRGPVSASRARHQVRSMIYILAQSK